MGYARRPEFDQPTAEDAERSRRVMLWIAPAIMLQQASRLLERDATTLGQFLQVASWSLLTLAILWVLAGWPARWLSERDQMILNDEGQRAMRADAMRWGMIAAAMIGCGLMVATVWIAFDARVAINALVTGAIVTAALRLAWVNRAEPAEDE